MELINWLARLRRDVFAACLFRAGLTPGGAVRKGHN